MASSIQNHNTSRFNLCSFCVCCTMWFWKAFKWIPVLLIISIVSWSYYAYVIHLCFSAVENIIQRIVYLVFYHILFIMFIWSYWRTIFAEVTDVPSRFKLPEADLQKLLSADSEEAQRNVLENFAKELPIATRTMSGAIRYCNRCVLVKPDRAHHCSICAKCVLKMDHHCPWVNNCVCYNNYKFFILFLGYALIYCAFVMTTSLPYFIQFWQGDFSKLVGVGRYHVVFAFFVSLMFGISLGSLFGYHIFLVLHNRTTLEAFRAPMFRGGPDKNGFSLGTYNNFKEVFGNNPHLWFLPVFTSSGEGSEYPVRREHQLQTFTTPPDGQYDSMGNTCASFGDGIVHPQLDHDEDSESLLSSRNDRRWERQRRSRQFDYDSSSYDDEISL